MKLDPGIHIVMYSVLFLKPGVIVGEVRDLPYDTEDSIEFVLHLDTNRSLWPRLQQSIQSSF